LCDWDFTKDGVKITYNNSKDYILLPYEGDNKLNQTYNLD
jgi:hypothetical protein